MPLVTLRKGFSFQIKRSRNFEITRTFPTKRISLQWVNGKHFNEQAMLNNGVLKIDNRPVCAFEASAYKVQPPGKSLNTIDEASFVSFLAMEYTSQSCDFWPGKPKCRKESCPEELPDMDRRVCRPTRQGWDVDPGGQKLPSRDSTVVLFPAKRGQ